MSLLDLPPDVLEKIFFHLSPSTLEILRNAVNQEVPSVFLKTITYVQKVKDDCCQVRRDFPASVNTVLRLFPHKLRSIDDSVNLQKMAHCLRAKVRYERLKEKRFDDFFIAERSPSIGAEFVFKVDPLTGDIALYNPVHHVMNQVSIYSGKDATMINAYNIAWMYGFEIRGRHLVVLRLRLNHIILLCHLDVNVKSWNERQLELVGFEMRESPRLTNALFVSDDYAVVRICSTLLVFTFPSLEYLYQKNIQSENADIFKNLLYLVKDKNVIVFDLNEQTVTRRVAWKSADVAAGFLNWPYLWNHLNEFCLIVDETAKFLEWKKLRDGTPVRFYQCKGISELIVVEKNPGIFEIVDLTTDKVIRSLPLVLKFGQRVYDIFVNDLNFYFVLFIPTTLSFSFCCFSFD